MWGEHRIRPPRDTIAYQGLPGAFGEQAHDRRPANATTRAGHHHMEGHHALILPAGLSEGARRSG